MGVRSLGRIEPILGGALPIWGRLATSLDSLAECFGRNRILKAATHPRRGTADRSQYRQAVGVGAEAVIV